MSWHFSLETAKVIGKWKNRQRKRVPEFTSERVKILVNSCIRKMDRIGMRIRRKPCAARPRKGWRVLSNLLNLFQVQPAIPTYEDDTYEIICLN